MHPVIDCSVKELVEELKGQDVQIEALASEYVSASHESQDKLPAIPANFPAGHLSHVGGEVSAM